jgi:methylated-DNA-[protein]-cysteine S-methyltransferase
MRALQRFVVDRVPSPLGPLVLVSDGSGALRALKFHDQEARMERQLRLHYGEGDYTLVAGRAPDAITTALAAYFAGDLRAIDAVPVHTGGTEFQRIVWAALRRISAVTTTTYSQLATVIGRPRACRAVGLANGANPVGIVVPCHRVIGADGTLTGYGGGIDRKRWLLDHERRWWSELPAGREGMSA